ncbi:MAG TPA: hypothetical protein VK610_04150, partial [Rhodothermales bacterium]|nr:hypothetical protein [Rhodothermales bacterium]
TGTALFGPSGSLRHQALCLLEGNVRIAYLGTRSPDPVTPGLYTGLRPSFNIQSYEYGADTFIFVADTSSGYIRGVFASRTKSIGVTQDFFTSIIHGGFNAAVEEMAEC